MNKHLPSNDKHLHNHQVITFLRSDRPALHKGQTSLRRLTNQSAATLRATLVQAAEEYADHHSLSLVSTRDQYPRFYVDGKELLARIPRDDFKYQSGQVNLAMVVQP